MTVGPMHRRAIAPVVSGVALALACVSVHAQTPDLDIVEARMQEGRIGEARAELQRWWLTARPQAAPSEVERSLWLRGRLTVDPSLAEIDYQRLILEFPNGRFVAAARVRLARSARARGDLPTALTHYEAIQRHHPDSRQRTEARAWIRANGERARRARPAGRNGDAAVDDAPERVVYTLQLGAFETRAGADALVARARSEGLAPRIVRTRGDRLSLLRVRIGRFSSPEAAGATQDRVRSLGFAVTLVPDAGQEVEPDTP